MWRTRDFMTYAGQPVCRRCGSGWPNCVDLEEQGWSFEAAHETTCERYHWAADTCGRCTLERAWYVTHPAEIDLPDWSCA